MSVNFPSDRVGEVRNTNNQVGKESFTPIDELASRVNAVAVRKPNEILSSTKKEVSFLVRDVFKEVCPLLNEINALNEKRSSLVSLKSRRCAKEIQILESKIEALSAKILEKKGQLSPENQIVFDQWTRSYEIVYPIFTSLREIREEIDILSKGIPQKVRTSMKPQELEEYKMQRDSMRKRSKEKEFKEIEKMPKDPTASTIFEILNGIQDEKDKIQKDRHKDILKKSWERANTPNNQSPVSVSHFENETTFPIEDQQGVESHETSTVTSSDGSSKSSRILDFARDLLRGKFSPYKNSVTPAVLDPKSKDISQLSALPNVIKVKPKKL